jgi:hypothetical protein
VPVHVKEPERLGPGGSVPPSQRHHQVLSLAGGGELASPSSPPPRPLPPRGTGSGSTASGSPAAAVSSSCWPGTLPWLGWAVRQASPTSSPSPAREAATRPSELRKLNVDTPVAAAICRSVWPAASSSPIRAASLGVSFDAHCRQHPGLYVSSPGPRTMCRYKSSACLASATAARMEWTLSFPRMFRMWVRSVCTDRHSRSAISSVFMPRMR